MQTVDYADAIAKAGGNAELAKELFGMLLQELPGLREQLGQALANGDLAAAWDLAHKIYGSTAYCGVPELGQAAAAMETAIKACDTAGAAVIFTSLESAIANLLREGPEHLEKNW